MDAGAGVKPAYRAYETRELIATLTRNETVGGAGPAPATSWPQTKHSTN